jgi:Domain of unknown function (DUF2760)
MGLGTAFQAFFAALFNRQKADRIRAALMDTPTPNAAIPHQQDVAPKQPVKTFVPIRSDALTLLSTLQREARLVDLICEPLESFSDTQIGAAAREVLRDSQKALERMFAITPLSDKDEGSEMSIPTNHSPIRLRLVGKSQGQSGTVIHRGWQATRCELPSWQGDKADSMILAPTEVEVS